jgi:DNA-binding XRE family transcriptional regulator
MPATFLPPTTEVGTDGEVETTGGRVVPVPTTHTLLPHLRAWRMHQLMTVRGLADKAGVAFSTVARIERGKPSTGINAIKLARALGVTVRDLKEVEPED